MKPALFSLLFTFFLFSITSAQTDTSVNSSYLKDNRLLASINKSSVGSFISLQSRLSSGLSLDNFQSDHRQQTQSSFSINVVKYAFPASQTFGPTNLNLSGSFLKRLYTENNIFFQFGASLRNNQTTDFERTRFTPVINIGIGKGRLDRVGEKMLVDVLISKLGRASEINPSQKQSIAEFIRNQKNHRQIYNLGSVDDEIEALTHYLIDIGVINSNLNAEIHKLIIRVYYKALPALNRQEGKTIGLYSNVSSTFSSFSDEIFDINRDFGNLNLTLSYTEETYLTNKFQIRKSASISSIWLEGYMRGYGISEEIAAELSYYPEIHTRYTIGAGLYNRFHTLNELLNYGLEIEGGFNRIVTQRLVIDFSVKTQLSFNSRLLGFAELGINF